MDRKHLLLAVLLLAGVTNLEASDAMKYIAAGFMRVIEECKKDNVNDRLFSDLYNFWKLDYTMLNRDTGCAIICMSKKLELVDDSGKVHHGNATEFAKKHGAADDVAAKMITVIHDCEAKSEGIADDCSRVLEVAKCFRTGIHELHWEPSADIVLTEVLAEI